MILLAHAAQHWDCRQEPLHQLVQVLGRRAKEGTYRVKKSAHHPTAYINSHAHFVLVPSMLLKEILQNFLRVPRVHRISTYHHPDGMNVNV